MQAAGRASAVAPLVPPPSSTTTMLVPAVAPPQPLNKWLLTAMAVVSGLAW